MSLVKDIGQLYKAAWYARKDIKKEIRRTEDLEERLLSRGALAWGWFMFFLIHAIVIGIPAGIVFAILGHMGVYG